MGLLNLLLLFRGFQLNREGETKLKADGGERDNPFEKLFQRELSSANVKETKLNLSEKRKGDFPPAPPFVDGNMATPHLFSQTGQAKSLKGEAKGDLEKTKRDTTNKLQNGTEIAVMKKTAQLQIESLPQINISGKKQKVLNVSYHTPHQEEERKLIRKTANPIQQNLKTALSKISHIEPKLKVEQPAEFRSDSVIKKEEKVEQPLSELRVRELPNQPNLVKTGKNIPQTQSFQRDIGKRIDTNNKTTAGKNLEEKRLGERTTKITLLSLKEGKSAKATHSLTPNGAKATEKTAATKNLKDLKPKNLIGRNELNTSSLTKEPESFKGESLSAPTKDSLSLTSAQPQRQVEVVENFALSAETSAFQGEEFSYSYSKEEQEVNNPKEFGQEKSTFLLALRNKEVALRAVLVNKTFNLNLSFLGEHSVEPHIFQEIKSIIEASGFRVGRVVLKGKGSYETGRERKTTELRV